MDTDVLYIVMPAYNEAETIADVVRDWYLVLTGKSPESRLVVADAGSTDATHQILQDLQTECPQLMILENTQKQHGPKLLALYRYAAENGADYIFQTDSDGQTDPREFAGFWARRDRYDVICGNRNDRQDGKSRVMVEMVVCLLLRLYFGVKVPDANAPFRLMKASVAAKYLDRFQPDYPIPNIILTAFFAYYHESLTFVPVTFKPRQGGANSIDLRKIFKIGWNALGDFHRFRKDMRRSAPAAKST